MKLKTFIKLILEARTPGTAIFIGRMQPITLAHYNIIEQARKTYDDIFIVIVKGAKTSADKRKNPFTLGQRVQFIYRAFDGKIPMDHIIKAPTGFTPDILDYLDKYISKKKLKKRFVIFAGADRADDYKRQIDKYYEGEAKIDIEVIPREEDSISATKVRKALIDNNLNEFKRLMPQTLWNEFDNMRKILLSKVNSISEHN